MSIQLAADMIIGGIATTALCLWYTYIWEPSETHQDDI